MIFEVYLTPKLSSNLNNNLGVDEKIVSSLGFQ
jgi:hypothetical protein